jgi:hypothetical protein
VLRRERHASGRPSNLFATALPPLRYDLAVQRGALGPYHFVRALTASVCVGCRIPMGFSVPLVSKAAVLASLALPLNLVGDPLPDRHSRPLLDRDLLLPTTSMI